jgi:lipopolysaccharide transport system permease protein
MRGAITAAWQFRHFVRSGIQSDLAIRFARSRLGTTWSILHPLAQSAIYVIVLAEVLGARLPNVASKSAYPIYLLAGMAAWSLFNEIVARSLTIFIDYSAALKKVAFPRLCLPLIVWGGALLNHALLLVALALVAVCLGRFDAMSWLYLPVGILLVSLVGFGVGILAGIFNVFCRDVGQAFSIVLQVWFWFTPVVYPIEVVPADLRWLIEANPLTPLVRSYQDALLWHTAPEPQALLRCLVIGLSTSIMAWFLFRRAASELVDAL